jgi:hypothetical protein
MKIECTCLAKSKLHDATIYAAYMAMIKKNAPGKFAWRIISLELFTEIYSAGDFVRDPHTSADNALYHTAI